MTETVERTIEIEADPEQVWELLVDDDEREAWFGGPTTLDPVPGGAGTFTDPDGTRRDAVVDDSDPGRRLSWTWWPDGDADDRSHVTIELEPVGPGRPGAPAIGTRVTVVEVPMVPTASASVATTADQTCSLVHRRLDLPALELHAMLRTQPTRCAVA